MSDFDLQQQELERRRQRYAQMAQQSQAPQGQMVGRHYVAPSVLQYIASGLRGIGGMAGEAQTAQELKDLGAKRQSAIAEALRGFQTAAQGRPDEVMPEGVQGPPQPAQAPDMRSAYAALLAAPDSGLRQAGMQGLVQLPQMEARAADRAEDREFRRQQAELQNQNRIEQLQMQHQNRMDALQAQNASRQDMLTAQQEFQREMANLRGSMASQQPYFQPVQTGQGVFAFNARTGKVEPVTGPGGAPIVGAAADPALQGKIAGAKAGATTTAKGQAEAEFEAPKVIQQGEQAIQLVDELLQSPGFKQAVGASRLMGIQNIPGTAAKDFDIRLDQLKGQQFLQAFETLKGGGQITEMEGKKATDAISRMNAAGSEEEFTKAAREFQNVIRAGVDRARGRIGDSHQPQPQMPEGFRVVR